MVFDLKAEETPADGSLRRSVLKPPFTSYAPGPGESGRGGSSSDAATEPRREPRGDGGARLSVVGPAAAAAPSQRCGRVEVEPKGLAPSLVLTCIAMPAFCRSESSGCEIDEITCEIAQDTLGL